MSSFWNPAVGIGTSSAFEVIVHEEIVEIEDAG